MIKKLVAWTEKFANHKHALTALFIVAFSESSFFLVPPDVLIIAMFIHTVKKSWIKIASVSTVGSVTGGLFGYLIGSVFYNYVGVPIVNAYHLQAEMLHVQTLFQNNAFLSILVAAFTPIPYKVFTIASGLFSVNIFTFVIASIIGRGGRFFLVAYFTNRYGAKVREIIFEKWDKALLVIGVIILALAYYFSK